MRRNVLLILNGLCILFLFMCPERTFAESLMIPLQELTPAKSVDLKCVSSNYSLILPIPERWKIDEILLNFNYVNSTGLLQNKSRMTIKVNGYPVAQVNLNPLAPEGSVKLSIPTLLLEPGYNNVTFNVSQHYSLECEQFCTDDLWTTLKLDQAFLKITYTLKPVPQKLSAINDFLFDSKISPSGEVHLVLENTNPDMLTIAGIVASGVAKRFDYKKVVFTVSESLKQGCDNLLIGNADYVHKFIKSNGASIQEYQGPFLKIMHLPQAGRNDKTGTGDPYHAMLVVSGLNLDQVKLAAETFAIMSTSFPSTDSLVAMEFTLPDIEKYGGRHMLIPDKQYTFKNLDFDSHTFRGINPAPKEIAFRLPADYLIKPNIYANLSLYYTYGAAMRTDSVINISLNGKLIRSIRLENTNGDIIEGYKLKIPTYMFKPGDNVLRFEPVLMPFTSRNCEDLLTDSLWMTILSNSMLYFPPMPHIVELPNIELLMLNGFPVTRWPDGHEALIYLTNNDFNTISSALNIMGMITQKNGYPLFGVKFTNKDPKKFNGELIVLGDASTIPKVYKEAAPLRLAKETTVPYPVARNWRNESSLAYSKQISGINPGEGVLMEFHSPFTEGRTVVMLTASTTSDLRALSVKLTDTVIQAKCEGGLVMIDLSSPDRNVLSLQIGEKYFAGKTSKLSFLDRYLYFYPWLYYVVLSMVILFLGLLLFYLLTKYRKRRLKSESLAEKD